jgi:RNA methyltransferase, TrmH family
VITSASNPRIKLVRALQARRRERETEQAFVVEGVRLAEEAARAGVAARLVLHTSRLDARTRSVINQLARLGAEVEEVSPEAMAAASMAEAPPGLLVVAPAAPLAPPARLAFAVVLDGLSDPGNLGTVLRTAGAAGVDAVFMPPGTVDAYNPKVVRGAMGAHFQLPLVTADWDEIARALAGLAVWRAEARAGRPYDDVDLRRPCALLIGSEAAGVSPAADQLPANPVHIPMPGRAESLNAAVAAAVLMFEVVRQRRARPLAAE